MCGSVVMMMSFMQSHLSTSELRYTRAYIDRTYIHLPFDWKTRLELWRIGRYIQVYAAASTVIDQRPDLCLSPLETSFTIPWLI